MMPGWKLCAAFLLSRRFLLRRATSDVDGGCRQVEGGRRAAGRGGSSGHVSGVRATHLRCAALRAFYGRRVNAMASIGRPLPSAGRHRSSTPEASQPAVDVCH